MHALLREVSVEIKHLLKCFRVLLFKTKVGVCVELLSLDKGLSLKRKWFSTLGNYGLIIQKSSSS